ncbi:hypothetical protein N3K66_008643 [Trichothecium roseum]|uniref:Uncharacterized protein n=1 Tax=Trichothecium roseum TaxID=47278 RepID=A0ACC0UQR9_9HYPO|nr:hypothetical protein N3K66_008643 [Trichothecium roseum]
MPLEQTITIVNNSGKIISTGRQLLSVFKEARGAYQEKKAQIKSERLQRSQTFDSRSAVRRRDQYEDDEYEQDPYYDDKYDDPPPRRGWYDGHSEAGSRRSGRSRSVVSGRSSHRGGGERRKSSRPPLTANNLKTLSEVSSQAPSRPPVAYQSPYAETLNRELVVSKMDLTNADGRSVAASKYRSGGDKISRRRSFSQVGDRQYQRSSLDRGRRPAQPSNDRGGDDDDMHLAYGSVPPDLENRVDLEVAAAAPQEDDSEDKAKALVKKVEGLLDEAQCMQHGATATIQHLQQNPDAAAAVALTLAELSAIVGKMSPAILGFLKGGSPAVFALLASPQFLIGTGIAVGVTVVMFGGWKIVQRVKEQKAAREALAYEGVAQDRPAPLRTQTDYNQVDEALIVDDDLSSIETWRRGLPPSVVETAEVELITPEADRATRGFRSKSEEFDLKSVRSSRTAKTGKPTKTSKSKSKPAADSVAPTEKTGTTTKKPAKKKKDVKAIEDGRSQRAESEKFDATFKSKQRQGTNMLKAMFKNKKEKEVSRVNLVHV